MFHQFLNYNYTKPINKNQSLGSKCFVHLKILLSHPQKDLFAEQIK